MFQVAGVIAPEQVKEASGFLMDVGNTWGPGVMIVVLIVLAIGGLIGLYIWKGMPALANRRVRLLQASTKRADSLEQYKGEILEGLRVLTVKIKEVEFSVNARIKALEVNVGNIDSRCGDRGDQISEMLAVINGYSGTITTIKETMTALDGKLFNILLTRQP